MCSVEEEKDIEVVEGDGPQMEIQVGAIILGVEMVDAALDILMGEHLAVEEEDVVEEDVGMEGVGEAGLLGHLEIWCLVPLKA